MDRIMYIFLLLTGFYVTRSCAYVNVLFSEPKSWSEAQSFCRERCVDLVSVQDMREMQALWETFQGQYEDALWIGLYKGTDLNWQWSLAGERFYKEGEKTYFYSRIIVTNNCVGFNDGQPSADHCTTNKYGICFDESKQGVEQYVRTTRQLFWMGGREYCRANYTDLASVRNAAEAQMIQDVSGGMEVWVGLFRDRWLWSDKSLSSFRFFPDETQPYTNTEPACIAMTKNKSGRWSERSCDGPLPFLCKCPRSLMTVKVALGFDAGLDILDPVAQQNIIKQMELRLNQANLTRPVSLRWVKKSGGVFVKKSADVVKKDCTLF